MKEEPGIVREDDWVIVARSQALEDGAMESVRIGDRAIAIYRIEGRLYATDNVCTHGQALLTDGWLDGDVIECPLHGGRFQVASGKGLGAPIDCDLECHQIRERAGNIEVALTKVTT
jgi:naphthalene 1,2-dioxygenase system ferredoxin subunit